MKGPPEALSEIRVGIVTALPEECIAVRMLVDDLRDRLAPGDPNHYRAGWLPSRNPNRPHLVVVALQAQDGTLDAASICVNMARSFPELRVFVMSGIAGGIPAPQEPSRHVRLGDIVVATKGVIDYGHVRTVDGVDALRRPVDGPSKALLRADLELQMKELSGEEPWRDMLREVEAKAERFRRPPDDTDLLVIAGRPAHHPSLGQSGHEVGWPRVHRGAVASANRLLRDATKRDALASQYDDVRAVEMEGSGIAVGADLHGREWFMVRGIADYCDNLTKNDVWRRYAALAAATYVRALLAECQPFSETAGRLAAADGLPAIVDALLSLPSIRDDYQRRTILAQLPDHIRTAVPDSVTGRLHVVGLVRTCEQYPDGEAALVDALRLALGATSPEFLRIEAVIRSNWSAG